MIYAKKILLQEQSLFYSDINLLEAPKVNYLDTFKKPIFSSNPEAEQKLRPLVKEAEELIQKTGELSEVDRKKGWQLVIRFVQVFEDISLIIGAAVTGGYMGTLIGIAPIATAMGGSVTPLIIAIIINSVLGILINRLIVYIADSYEVKNEVAYAKQALQQLKKLEKKTSGKDKEALQKQITKIENALK